MSESTLQYRVRRRWAHPYLSVLACLAALIFGPVIWLTFQYPAQYGAEGIRAIVPPYFLFLYIAVGLALNHRVATVRPDSVRVSILPLPMIPGVTIARNDIRHVYARTEIERDEALQEIGRHYAAGVETSQGIQVGVTGPQSSLKIALERAEEIARILNAGQHPHAIYAKESPTATAGTIMKSHLLIWMGAFIVMFLIGVVWELSATTTNMR